VSKKSSDSRNNKRETTGECRIRRESEESPPPTQCSTKWAKEFLADSISEELVQALEIDNLETILLPARAILHFQREAKVPWVPIDLTSAELTRVSIALNLASDRSLVPNLVEIKEGSVLVHYREDWPRTISHPSAAPLPNLRISASVILDKVQLKHKPRNLLVLLLTIP
jgi:hypothetical protein|tara:strand:- start:162 stop:671 length:510 start_codon:yes stop_codon:yes gene_type:complete